MNEVTEVHSNEDPWGRVAAPWRTKGQLRSNGDAPGGFMGHKKADQGLGKGQSECNKVYRFIPESNRGGRAESRGPPETNKGKWKQRMMGQ